MCKQYRPNPDTQLQPSPRACTHESLHATHESLHATYESLHATQTMLFTAVCVWLVLRCGLARGLGLEVWFSQGLH